MKKKIKSFLGTGWSFPPTFDSFSYSIQTVTEEEDIRQSLFLLISTLPGERLMKPTYGCDLHSAVFDTINNTVKHHLMELITVAIIRYEPRISLKEVLIEIPMSDIGLIYITVHYTVRKTNIRSNIVYPFYYKEGTNLRDSELKEIAG